MIARIVRGTIAMIAWLLLMGATSSVHALDISTIGTSITAANTWQTAALKTLQRCGLGPVHISNHGKAGQTVAWGVEHVARALEGKPDVLIVEFAINDALKDGRGLSLSEAERLTRQLISTARRESPATRIYLLITNPVQGSKIASRPDLHAHYEMYRRLAAEEAIGLIDTEHQWAAFGSRILRDDLHPTKEGHTKVIASAVVMALAPECR
jgi:lysophospholipase L1-like esterase